MEPGIWTSPVSAGALQFPCGMPVAAASLVSYPMPPWPNILSVASAPEVVGKACPGPHPKFPTRVPPLWQGVPKPERIILHEMGHYFSMGPDRFD
ncbi:hypothetical protein [Nitrosomonas marina]|uniref:hypothetical protein n=1 Tax=Nitrosomonas marina TaxID=917 RepID=UPI0015A58235|nr:hypothetical protein [Nitrosomonas marina]